VKVFIIWSGPRSKEVAVALRNWLPDVIQACEPWVSPEDIDPGARWGAELAAQLEQTQFAVLCLTSDNLSAPWIHFEAGAISKKLDDKTRVAPYLLDIKPTDIVGPLVQFQAVNADPEGTLKLVHSINHALDSNALANDRIDKYFKKCWPELEPILKKIPPSPPETSKPVRSEKELLEEILGLVRDQSRESLEKDETPFKWEETRDFLTDEDLNKRLHHLRLKVK